MAHKAYNIYYLTLAITCPRTTKMLLIKSQSFLLYAVQQSSDQLKPRASHLLVVRSSGLVLLTYNIYPNSDRLKGL